MTVLVDTSVWSQAFRRDNPTETPELVALRRLLGSATLVSTTGIVVQELLQGVVSTSAREQISQRMRRLRVVQPTVDDHVAAAAIRNACRAKGVQLGTVDALIAQLCIGNDLALLTADGDFRHAAKHTALRLFPV